MYLGYPWQAINVVVIFLMIGIGMDGIFLLLSSWTRSEQTSRDLVTRMSVTYSDAAVSLTITQLTNILSFLVGAAVPGFPCVQIFCVYAACGLCFSYMWTITMFGACLAISGHLEHSNRHSLLFTKVKPKSLAQDSSWLYRLLFVGGIDTSDPTNTQDNKDEKMMAFFKHVVAPTLNYKPFKAFIILCFLCYLAVSGLGIYNLREGLQLSNLAMEDSHVVPHFQANEMFRDLTYRIQVVLPDVLDYHNQTVQKELLGLVKTLEESEYISNQSSVKQFWLAEFLSVARINFILFNITTKEQFMSNLQLFLEESKNFTLSTDVILTEDASEVRASRLFLQTDRIQDSQAEQRMLLDLRKVVAKLPFRVILFNPLFFIFDQFAEVFNQTLLCVCLCVGIMSVVILIFIPSKVCVIWVIFSVVSVEVGVLGMMSFWKINLDVISMIVLIMGIGFSVDFSAHISYHYLSAEEELGPEERLAHCLFALGPPILQGALTTMLSVLPLVRHPSYVIITFSKMIFLVILLGLLHALLLLPVLLTLFGPGACRRGKAESAQRSQFNILSPLTSASDTFIYEEGRLGLSHYKRRCVSPETLKSGLLLLRENERDRGSTATAAASDLHLSFFRPNESDDSEANLSTEYNLPLKVIRSNGRESLQPSIISFQTRAFSDSSYYSHQKRHLRRSVKNISMRGRAKSDVGVLDNSRHSYSQSLKRKLSHLHAEIKGLSPLRQSRVRIESEGLYNGGFVENEVFSSNSVNDNSMLSTFR